MRTPNKFLATIAAVTLRQPGLVQFAQPIGVDYHLEPLNEEEIGDYIQHRCRIAGGNPELFSDQARCAVFEHTSGVPRLINLLCDTALVYGYAEQREQLDAELVHDVARDKQWRGLLPGAARSTSPADTPRPEARAEPDHAPQSTEGPGGAHGPRPAQVRGPSLEADAPGKQKPADVVQTSAQSEAIPKKRDSHRTAPLPEPTGSLRVAIAADSELLRIYLSKLLSKFGIEVVAAVPLTSTDLQLLEEKTLDMLLVELDDHLDHLGDSTYELLESWEKPVLFNDSLATEASLSQPNRLEYGRKLSEKLFSLLPQAPQSVA